MSEERGRLRVHTREPMNAETAPEALGTSFVTGNEEFFIRSHAPVPVLDAASFRVEVDGLVERAASYTVAELERAFASVTLTATLVCAGNRRAELHAAREVLNEVIWDRGAIGNAIWGGVRLMDVLDLAGVNPEARYVWFEGADAVSEHGGLPFASCLPLDAPALRDAVLALTMNGSALPPDHGFPLRLVVPRCIGAKSIKWLRRIRLEREESPSASHMRSYKVVAEDPGAGFDWSKVPPIDSPPLSSAILIPEDGDSVSAGRVEARGYAYSAFGRIDGVEVRLDDGDWLAATVEFGPVGVWALWGMSLSVEAGVHTLEVRARDSSGGVQGGSALEAWNYRGYVNGSVHRIEFTALR